MKADAYTESKRVKLTDLISIEKQERERETARVKDMAKRILGDIDIPDVTKFRNGVISLQFDDWNNTIRLLIDSHLVTIRVQSDAISFSARRGDSSLTKYEQNFLRDVGVDSYYEDYAHLTSAKVLTHLAKFILNEGLSRYLEKKP